MNAETTVQPAGDTDDPEVAFEAMSRRLAGLTAAVEGFAARQQELHARDSVRTWPRSMPCRARWSTRSKSSPRSPRGADARDPCAADRGGRGEGARGRSSGLASANRELGAAIQSLKGVVTSAMKAETQKHWIIGAAIAALIVGFAFGAVVPTRIAQSVPESWHWPEQRAADMLLRGEWNAGMRLLQVADPARLRALDDAARLVKGNAQALADCRSRRRNPRKA